MIRGDGRSGSLTRGEKGASHNPFSRRTNNAAEIVSAERGFSGRWKAVSQATFSLSRCERSGLQCDGMSLSGQPWMALCKWQPGPFSHSSQLSQPLTSQRQEQLARPVPYEEPAQSSQPDFRRKVLYINEMHSVLNRSGCQLSPVVRIVRFTTCLTIMLRILNIMVDWILWATPKAVNSQRQKASRETTILPMNRVACSWEENTGSIRSSGQHSVASFTSCCYGLLICNGSE